MMEDHEPVGSVEERAPLHGGAPPPRSSKAAPRWHVKVIATIVGLGFVAAMVIATWVAAPGRASAAAPTLARRDVELTVSNAYERDLGVAIGDGWYPFDNLVEAHKYY